MRTLGWIIIAVLIAWAIWYYAISDRADNGLDINLNNNDAVLYTTDVELSAEDSGRTFTYAPGTVFSLFIPEGDDELDVECDPDNALALVEGNESAPTSPEGQRVIQYRAVTEGSCDISYDDLDYDIRIVPRS
jgi:hypothetical protein